MLKIAFLLLFLCAIGDPPRTDYLSYMKSQEEKTNPFVGAFDLAKGVIEGLQPSEIFIVKCFTDIASSMNEMISMLRDSKTLLEGPQANWIDLAAKIQQAVHNLETLQGNCSIADLGPKLQLLINPLKSVEILIYIVVNSEEITKEIEALAHCSDNYEKCGEQVSSLMTIPMNASLLKMLEGHLNEFIDHYLNDFLAGFESPCANKVIEMTHKMQGIITKIRKLYEGDLSETSKLLEETKNFGNYSGECDVKDIFRKLESLIEIDTWVYYTQSLLKNMESMVQIDGWVNMLKDAMPETYIFDSFSKIQHCYTDLKQCGSDIQSEITRSLGWTN